MSRRFFKDDVARELDEARGYPRGMEGFEILLYGWRQKHKMKSKTIFNRDWMTYAEVESFGLYVGVDLRKVHDS